MRLTAEQQEALLGMEKAVIEEETSARTQSAYA